MIAVELQGRMGNQMFQYAFALAAARRLDTEFVLCGSSWTGLEHEELSHAFRLDAHGLPFVTQTDYPIVRVGHEDWDQPEDVLANLTDSTRYSGFFQSERFFGEVASETRAAFDVRPEHRDSFSVRYGELVSRPYVCCHIRRTDYLTLAGGVALPLAYYRDAIGLAARRGKTPIVFVGDDLTEVRSAFGGLSDVHFEQNEPIIDFQLLLHSRIVVASNSTFAWWGAWLGDSSKTVYAPKDWINWTHRIGWRQSGRRMKRGLRGWEYPPAVVPDSWAQVMVRRPHREILAPSSLKNWAALNATNARAALTERTSVQTNAADSPRQSRERPRTDAGRDQVGSRVGVLVHRLRAERYARGEFRRRVRFYRQFVERDGLCFDVGANIGARTALFLAVPSHVIAIEPQTDCHRELAKRFGNNPRCDLVHAALGSMTCETELRTTRAGSVYASLSSEWIERTRASGRFATFDWDATERVSVTTLDALIEKYGVPSFCKIDVEGFELPVLQGLSRPLRSLSIEFTPELLESTEACIRYLETLGAYEFNYSLDESLVLARNWWMRPQELLAALEPLRGNPTVFGDVYARLQCG